MAPYSFRGVRRFFQSRCWILGLRCLQWACRSDASCESRSECHSRAELMDRQLQYLKIATTQLIDRFAVIPQPSAVSCHLVVTQDIRYKVTITIQRVCSPEKKPFKIIMELPAQKDTIRGRRRSAAKAATGTPPQLCQIVRELRSYSSDIYSPL